MKSANKRLGPTGLNVSRVTPTLERRAASPIKRLPRLHVTFTGDRNGELLIYYSAYYGRAFRIYFPIHNYPGTSYLSRNRK